MSKTITVTIDPTGEVKVEAHNFKGQGCQAATKAIEEALGVKTSEVRKPEFHLSQANPLSQRT